MLNKTRANDSSSNQFPHPATTTINEKNHLVIAGCDVVELAKEFGTPLYVMDETHLRKTCRAFIDVAKKYAEKITFLYASKALNTLVINKIIAQEKFGIDVMSEGELFGALQAGFQPELIYFHGNNKSKQELQQAIKFKCKIVVDNWHELTLLQQLSSDPVSILLRVSPQIESYTHSHIETGQRDSKFGFDLDDIERVFYFLTQHKNLHCVGLHAHIGSQVSNLNSYAQLAKTLLTLFHQANFSFQLNFSELNLGGGLAINYTGDDTVPSIQEWMETLLSSIQKMCAEKNMAVPNLFFEPGRSVVATAGVTLYSVGSSKTITGGTKYISVDGGMSDNPRPVTYDAKYKVIKGNQVNETETTRVTIAGKHCETGDILFKAVDLPPLHPDDLLVVFATGAYNYSQSSNYNKTPRPAMVLLLEGKAEIIIEREKIADLFLHDREPSWFSAS